MIILFRADATPGDIRAVVELLEAAGRSPSVETLGGRTLVRAEAGAGVLEGLAGRPGVERVVAPERGFFLATREWKPENTVVRVGEVALGGPAVAVIAGPCSVESADQLLGAARAVRAAGASLLRGGAWKPRTSPWTFQGLGSTGLRILARAREETGLPVVTEVMSPDSVPEVAGLADVLQVGSRNIQNFPLLSAVGRSGRPVLLKRGMMTTVDEFLAAAEYILASGNADVILCERGIRTFETRTRNTFDVSAIPVLKALSHLPVIADPSHAAGQAALVRPLARAAVAAGADGIMVEVHPDPARALSDGPQSLTPAEFEVLMADLAAVAAAVGRPLAGLRQTAPGAPAP